MIKDAARREDEELSSLQIDEGTEDESASTLLKWLDTIAQNRREFRSQFESFGIEMNSQQAQKEQKSIKNFKSSVIVEELMLMAHTALLYKYQDILGKADEAIDYLIDMEELVRKKAKELRAQPQPPKVPRVKREPKIQLKKPTKRELRLAKKASGEQVDEEEESGEDDDEIAEVEVEVEVVEEVIVEEPQFDETVSQISSVQEREEEEDLPEPEDAAFEQLKLEKKQSSKKEKKKAKKGKKKGHLDEEDYDDSEQSDSDNDEMLFMQSLAFLEKGVQAQASVRTQEYISRIFEELGVEFKCSSMRDIQLSFREVKSVIPDSNLFKEYFEVMYRMCYQHFANIVNFTKD